MPTGKLTVIRDNFKSVDEYFGLIQCKVLPPTSLYLPVLPVTINEKLMFPLCMKCAELQQSDPCQHTDKERSLEGVWVSIELQKALQLGYKVTHISEVWHFEERACYNPETMEGGLFTEYINRFLKIKQECSDWPDDVKTESQKQEYLDNYLKHEGIQLDPSKICKNPGLRTVAKLMLNVLWGRFGMRDNFTQTEYITAPKRLYEIIGSTQMELQDVNFFGENVAEVSYKSKDSFIRPQSSTNVVIASFTTAHARLKL